MLFSFLRKLMLPALFCLLSLNVTAQNPGDAIWAKYYGGDKYDEANAVINAHDSGYIFVGATQSYGLDRWANAFVGKTNSNGDSLFTFHFGGSGSDVLTDVIQTTDGNYLAVGLSDSKTDFEQMYMVKFNDEGDTLWTKTYGGPAKEIAYAVLQTDDNGFMISALTSSTGAGAEDVWILRTDSNGDTLWTRTYGTAGNDAGYGMCKTSDGAYVVTGAMDFSSLMVMKIDSTGDQLWSTSFGGADFEEGVSIIEAANTDLMVVGHTSSFGSGELDIYLVRLNSDGILIYEKTYGSSAYEEGRDIIQLNNEEFIIGGNTTQNSGSNMMDYYIISVDSAGEINWSKILGGAEDPERCYDLFNTGDGNFLIAGSNSIVPGELEHAALTMMYGDIQTDVNDGLAGSISFALHNAYPNPFNPSTNIRYSIPQSSFVTIKVYDILGNEAAELVNEYMNPGTYTLTFNTAEYNLSSGVYFYTIRAGNFTSTKKFILMK